MALISDVKCGKCDRRYSGLRGRCPYCGARRGKAGKHATKQSNTTGKLVIGLILLAVLLAAAIYLVLRQPPEETDTAAENTTEETAGQIISNDEDVTSVEGEEYVPSDSAETDESKAVGTDGETAEGTSETEAETEDMTVVITWLGEIKTDMTLSKGFNMELTYTATPEPENPTVEWASSNEDVFTILQTGELTATGEGTATLTLTVNGVSAECIVRVNG